MHFEILVEDSSGKVALENLIPKIVGTEHTFRIHAYKGIGRIPKGLKPSSDPSKRILLDQLPQLIRGYGQTFASYSANTVILMVICDLDQQCLSTFRQELLSLVDACIPRPETQFCIAIEEGEAWYLGDIAAVKKAYPTAKDAILHSYSFPEKFCTTSSSAKMGQNFSGHLYINDSICGTWETLADALFSGGAKKLSKAGWQTIGKEKATWAARISPQMNVNNNLSPSFCYFRNKLRRLIDP